MNLMMDSLSGKEAKEKARFVRYNGLLWSLGVYVIETGDQTLKSELQNELTDWI